MAIERVHLGEGRLLKAFSEPTLKKEVTSIVTRNRGRGVLLQTGEHDLTPPWLKEDLRCTVLVTPDGRGIFTYDEGKLRVRQRDVGDSSKVDIFPLPADKKVLPDDTSFVMVFGPARDQNRKGIFELLSFIPGPSPEGIVTPQLLEETRHLFPLVKEQDVAKAYECVSAEAAFDKREFSQTSQQAMHETDPGLHYSLRQHQVASSELLGSGLYNQLEPSFQFGASFMYRIVEELRKGGYPFPVVELPTVMKDQDQLYQDVLILAAVNKVGQGNNEENVIDILRKNPGLFQIFQVLDHPEQVGACHTYQLMRRQHKLNKRERRK